MSTLTRCIAVGMLGLFAGTGAHAASLDDPVALESFVDGVVQSLMKTNSSPSGTVAIALEMCIVYPQSTPGGWNILGRTPVPLFDARWERPALLCPGDALRFRAIARPEHETLARGFAEGSRDPQRECRA